MTRTEELLDEVAAYADRLADSDALADTGSMATAEALAELYEKRDWVEEWLEQKPIREVAHRRPYGPDSRNRFAQWLIWKEEQRGRRGLQTRRAYQLLNAREIAECLHSVQTDSEGVLRPLDWLRKQRLIDRIPEVWQRAVELAGSADAVTSAHTRQALIDFKHDVLGARGVKAAVTTAKAARHRMRAQGAVEDLLFDGDATEVEKFKAYLIKRGLA